MCPEIPKKGPRLITERCPECGKNELVSELEEWTDFSVDPEGRLSYRCRFKECSCGYLKKEDPEQPWSFDRQKWLRWHKNQERPAPHQKCQAVLNYLACGLGKEAIEEYVKLVVDVCEKSGLPEKEECPSLEKILAVVGGTPSDEARAIDEEMKRDYEKWFPRFESAVTYLKKMAVSGYYEQALEPLFTVAPCVSQEADNSMPFSLTSALLFGIYDYFHNEPECYWCSPASLCFWGVVSNFSSSGEAIVFASAWLSHLSRHIPISVHGKVDSLLQLVEQLEGWQKNAFDGGDAKPDDRGGRYWQALKKNAQNLRERNEKERGIVDAIRWGFPFEALTVDHAVHSVLDTVSSVFANSARNTKSSEEWEQWVALLERLSAVAKAGTSEETIRAVGEYLHGMRLIRELQLAENDPLKDPDIIAQHLERFEMILEPKKSLEGYLSFLAPKSAGGYKWYADLLRLQEPEDHDDLLYNRSKNKGVFLPVTGLFAESCVRQRALELSLDHLKESAAMRSHISAVFPDVAKDEFLRDAAKLQRLGLDPVLELTEHLAGTGFNSEEPVAAFIGIKLRRLEDRLRGIVKRQLAHETDEADWYMKNEYRWYFKDVIERKRLVEEKGLLFRVTRDDTSKADPISLITFMELWTLLTECKRENKFRFTPIGDLVPVREQTLRHCVDTVCLVRNRWAHNRPLSEFARDFNKEYEYLIDLLDQYELRCGTAK
jgi:hypothetical protein